MNQRSSARPGSFFDVPSNLEIMLVDIEKEAEAGLGFVGVQAESNAPDSPSPKSSRVTTLVGSPSIGSDEKASNCEVRDSVWVRWSRSFRRCFESALWLRTKESDGKKQDGYEQDNIVRPIHDQPLGYPRLATFMDSDENFMIYRRFGYLQSRLLLERQDELRSLELQLDAMEAEELEETPHKLKTRMGKSPEKKALFESIETKWTSYCQLLSNAATMIALNKPTCIEQRSVATWLWSTKPVKTAEYNFVRRAEDLVILRAGREHAWLDSGIEKILHSIRWKPLMHLFQSKDTRAKTNGDDGTLLFTRSYIENFVVSLITIMILALLVVPIYALFKLSEPGSTVDRTSFVCIGVLLVSTLAFSACISLFTRAKRNEILGASAAYCAVLVVFIGNIGNNANLGQ